MEFDFHGLSVPAAAAIAVYPRLLARHVRNWLRDGLARVLRALVPLFELLVPPLGRRLRNWHWIWQPVFGDRWLNGFFADRVDPFRFENNPYEAGKYAHTLRVIGGRRYGRALEIGTAEGVFTRLLAPYCEALTGIDVSEVAVERARQRLAEFPHVEIRQAMLPVDLPAGPFDLIVASDVLYYLPVDVLRQMIPRLAQQLAPGGLPFALHYLGNFGQHTMGRVVHERLHACPGLELVHEETVEHVGPAGAGYTLTLLKRPADRD
ncbi:MAG: SAM-dependent methyltransferase [Oceanipulchritudo sp.]